MQRFGGETSSKIDLLKYPSPEEFRELFNAAQSTGSMLVILARCKVHYEGRAKSELGLGDRVIIIKPDGSFLIHQGKKREPVNWQPPDSTATLRSGWDLPVIRSVRRHPREVLEVELERIYLVVAFHADDYEDLHLVGSEADMADMIFRNPEIIEEGFKPVAREKPIKHGIVDIFGFDKDGNAVVLELKRRRAELHAVSQLKRYVGALKGEYGNVRGVLVAPSMTSGAKKLLREEGLEFRKVTPPKRGYHRVQRKLFEEPSIIRRHPDG